MNIKEINIWKNKLLDLGKRNNMVNFHDSKSGTIEIIYPDIYTVYKKISTGSSQVEIFDDKIKFPETSLFDEDEIYDSFSRQEYFNRFSKMCRNNQILLFKENYPNKKIVKNLRKKASEAITERGINILFLAFGFIKWKEEIESNTFFKAPILLVPITIVNESTNSPFYIRMLDEDIILNPTFKYLLSTQHNIELPTYDDEDLEEYLERIQDIIMPLGWNVVKEVKIGTFSFTKINMYFDLEKNEEIISLNHNIRLMTGLCENRGGQKSYETNFVEQKDYFITQHNVVDADYTQTEAIQYALQGKSFVLQGPPGTGKSQTITNMIAELLYLDKKVLFVSEKMAALEVVYNNLKRVGLDEFCLQLHSNKVNKKEFVDELYKTLVASKQVVKEDAKKNYEILNESKEKLDFYVNELYKVYQPINKSLYELLEKINYIRETKDVEYIIPNLNNLGEKELEEILELLTKFSSLEKNIGSNYKEHPLYGFLPTDNSYSFKILFKKLLLESLDIYKELFKLFNKSSNEYNFSCSSLEELNEYAMFLNECLKYKITDTKLYDMSNLALFISEIEKMKKCSSEVILAKKNIDEYYNSSFYDENAEILYNAYTKKYSSFFARMFNREYRHTRLRLLNLQKDRKKKVLYSEQLYLLNELIKYKKNLSEYNLYKEINNYSFQEFNGINSNWDLLILKLKNFYNFVDENSKYMKMNLDMFNKTNRNQVEKFIQDVFYLKNEINKKYNELQTYYDCTVINFKEAKIEDCYSILIRTMENFDSIDNWFNFTKILNDIKEKNLLDFIDKVLELNYPLCDLSLYYQYCFYIQWIDYIFSKVPKLADYTRLFHENDIKIFKEKDLLQIELSKAIIRSELSHKRPDLSMQISGSPVKIIEREHEKKRKLKPVRTLMAEIPDFIQRIKPCFLMSPLSVSTYLSDGIEFDVVIFDEASQVFPEDAIGAIYRSRQLIVVGDSKQMPPSNFFNTLDTSDFEEYVENSSDITGFESILDLCTSTFPKKSLLYHYRSKDESLITFSNKNFYNYDLITFPSCFTHSKDVGVDFHYVDNAIFDHKTKSNLKEAEKIVDMVFEHFKMYPERSLGVVAFNIGQQNLISRLLTIRREKDSSLDKYFDENVNEPFFVKNLETVQGDERDTIIFSITYSHDDKGQFALRFGPLNLVGGERRLNVAITRAKLNVKVVSSIKGYDIDVNRVSNLGPKLLHDYLLYAEQNGNNFIDVEESEIESDFKPSFEQDVHKFLTENGFEVDLHVGSSKLKIDMALKKPGSNQYVLAIECDGNSYYSTKSTRDRDRLKQSILEKMNWKVYRVWSTDWYKNHNEEKKALLEACEKALESNEELDFSNNDINNNEFLTSVVSTESAYTNKIIFDNHIGFINTLNKNSYEQNLKCIVDQSVPIALDYLLKKYGYKFGYWSATEQSRRQFTQDLIKNGYNVEEGYIYTPQSYNFLMRKNFNNTYSLIKTDIKYISPIEIRNGMYSIVKNNGPCDKITIYNFIRTILGYTKLSDNMRLHFDKAYELLEPYIYEKNGIIELKKDAMLELYSREEQKDLEDDIF